VIHLAPRAAPGQGGDRLPVAAVLAFAGARDIERFHGLVWWL